MTQPVAPTYQPQLYDASGQPSSLTGEDAVKALAEGKAAFLQGQKVHVVTQDGRVGSIPSSQASLIGAHGMRLATNEEVQLAKDKAQYGNFAGQVATGLASGLGTMTLGATDYLLKQLPGGQELLEKGPRANPGARVAGSVVGAVLPALVGDEAGVAGAAKEAATLGRGAETAGATVNALSQGGRILTAPARAVSRVGEGIENVVRAALGAEGEASTITGMAKKAIAKGAGSAAEMALYGGADQLNEDVLGNHEVNGEKLLAAMGHGALLGLAGGAGLSALGSLGREVLGRASPALDHMAEEQAFRTLNARKAFTTEADKIPGGIQGVGRRLLDEDLIKPGERLEDIAPRVSEARDKAGAEIGSILERADAAGYEGPSLKAITERVDKEIMPELKKLERTNAGAVGKVENLVADLHGFAGVPTVEQAAKQGLDREAMLENSRLTFKQAQDFRARLDDAIKWTTNPLAPVNETTEAMKKLRGIIETELEESGEKAANKLGGTFKTEYKQAKLAYRQLTVADKAAQDAVARGEANRVLSPSDYITGASAWAHHGVKAAGAAALGGVAGEAEGGHEGGVTGFLGGALTGVAAAYAHHEIRTRGNSLAAVMLDKLASLRGVERATQKVDTQIDRGISGFFRDERRVAPALKAPIAGEGGEHPSMTAIRQVTNAAANSNAHMAAIDRAAEPIAAHAPKIANSFQRAALRGTMFLANAVPQSNAKPSITPQFDHAAASISDAQRNDYQRQVQAVHDPATVLADMAAGKVTRAQVDAIKMVYPSLYQEIVTRVQQRLTDLKHPLDYKQKVQLSVLLGVPADETLSPQFVQAMQASYSQPGQPPGPPGGKGHKGPTATKRPMKGDLAADVSLTIGQHKT